MRVAVWIVLALLSGLGVAALSRAPRAPATNALEPTVDDPRGAKTASTIAHEVGSAEADAKSERTPASAVPDREDQPERPPPPKNPKTRAELETKYHAATPAELQARLDSLLEVLDAQIHQRMPDKTQLLPREALAKLSDEVGWLSERCAH